MRTKECSACGGALISGKVHAHGYPSYFIPRSDYRKLFPRKSDVLCDCCMKCGKLQNFRVACVKKFREH